MSKFTFKPKVKDGPEPRKVIGRIESIDRHSPRKLSRYSIVVDAIDAESDLFSSRMLSDLPESQFSILRIMTTGSKFLKMMELEGDENNLDSLVGFWVSIDLIPKGRVSGPIVQLSSLEERGYQNIQRFTLNEIEPYGREPDFPSSVGAAGNASKQRAAQLYQSGKNFRSCVPSHRLFAAMKKLKNTVDCITVFDVGHANFTLAMGRSREPLFHFDVGWPVAFNGKTRPSTLPVINFAEVVILSHWDWDHLHGYHFWSELRDKLWVAPQQNLGPGALRVATELDSKGQLLTFTEKVHRVKKGLQIGNLVIGLCRPKKKSTNAEARNNSGIALVAKLDSGNRALLPGDADYDCIEFLKSSMKLDRLVVSHHGAKVSGIIKANAKIADAVVSVGKGNVYRHPSPVALKDLRKHGWLVGRTCSHKGVRRGAKTLN